MERAIALLGPPGSGKGTQAARLRDELGFAVLATGDLLREARVAATDLGRRASEYMDRGDLVPDDLIVAAIRDAIASLDNEPIVFDGFPRTVAQAEGLDAMLEQRGSAISLVLALEVSEEELIQRLLNRGKTSGRPDDNEEIIRARIQEYENKTAPVAGHYANMGKVLYVKGEGSVDEIFNALCSHINTRTVA